MVIKAECTGPPWRHPLKTLAVWRREQFHTPNIAEVVPPLGHSRQLRRALLEPDVLDPGKDNAIVALEEHHHLGSRRCVCI
jgi:hypothetical protein